MKKLLKKYKCYVYISLLLFLLYLIVNNKFSFIEKYTESNFMMLNDIINEKKLIDQKLKNSENMLELLKKQKKLKDNLNKITELKNNLKVNKNSEELKVTKNSEELKVTTTQSVSK